MSIFLTNFSSAFNWTNGIKSYYSLDETSGVTAYDKLNLNNGTINGSATFYEGKLGGSIFFNNYYEKITGVTPIPFSDFTINSWVYFNDSTATGTMYASSSTLDPLVFFMTVGGNLTVWARDNLGVGIIQYDSGKKVLSKSWQMVTLTFNITSKNFTIFANSSQVASVTYTGGTWNNSLIHTLGVFCNSIDCTANNLTGALDEVGLWHRILNSSELTELYNSGDGLPFNGTYAIKNDQKITLISPTNNSLLSVVGTNFTAELNITGDNTYNYTWKNATIYLWNSSGLFNQTTYNITGNGSIFYQFIDYFTLGTYYWNIQGYYGNTTFSNFTWAINNYTYRVGATLSNVTYLSTVYETSNQLFFGTLTLLNGTLLYDVKLVYNGTEYSGSINNLGSNIYNAYSSIDIPTVTTTTNKSFYFKLIYSIGAGVFLYENSTSYNQTISIINLSNCNTITNQTLNFTLNNEENLTVLDTWNFLGTFEYWIGLGTSRKNTSINNLNINYNSLCINPSTNITYRADAIIQYEKTGFIKRNYYLYNASLTNITQNITLYSLQTASGTAFIVSVKDGSQLPITDAYIYVQRYYPGTGLFQTVAMAKTDGSGNTIAHFETETEDYKIIIMKNGIVIYTSPIQKVYCSATPCTLPIQTASAGVSGWNYIGNLSNLIYSGPTYNSLTNLISYTYIDTSGTTAYGRLWVYTINSATGKETICNINSTSNAVTLICDVTNITGTVYAEGYISRSPEILVWGVSFIINSIKAIMGLEGLFWATIIILIFAIAGVLMSGIAGGIIGCIIGFIGTGWLGIASFGLITIWGVIILGIIIIWQIKN